MAKRRNAKIMKKVEPSVKTIFLNTPNLAPGAIGTYTADLSQIASLVNRRFYRQGLVWCVSGMKLVTTNNASILVKKLPETWVMSNSWEKGFRAWQKMNNQALAESNSVKPKFLDFKIYADDIHHSAGFGANLLPIDSTLGIYANGEWESSKFVLPIGGTPTQTKEVIATGASYPGAGASGFDAVSLIEGYASSRALPDVLDPNAPQDAGDVSGTVPENWMAALFDQGTTQDEKVLEDMITENNIAPYPFENDGVNVDTMYPNGANQAPGLQIHDWELVTPTTIGGITHLKGGLFPCGLIRFDIANQSEQESNYIIQIDLVAGDHRGYLCEPMTEM